MKCDVRGGRYCLRLLGLAELLGETLWLAQARTRARALFAVLGLDGWGEWLGNEASRLNGHQVSARQQPVDAALEASLELANVIRGTYLPLGQLPVLPDEQGGRRRFHAVERGDPPVRVPPNREWQTVLFHELLGGPFLVPL